MDRLVGGRDTLASTSPVKTFGSYWPYATTLYDYIYRAMPFDAPQSLTADEVYAVTAWLLHENGITEADTVIDARALPQIPMPNRHGFVPDPRPDVRGP
jgi:cytochrome c